MTTMMIHTRWAYTRLHGSVHFGSWPRMILVLCAHIKLLNLVHQLGNDSFDVFTLFTIACVNIYMNYSISMLFYDHFRIAWLPDFLYCSTRRRLCNRTMIMLTQIILDTGTFVLGRDPEWFQVCVLYRHYAYNLSFRKQNIHLRYSLDLHFYKYMIMYSDLGEQRNSHFPLKTSYTCNIRELSGHCHTS